ncbi:MAG: PHP domain-containing protein [Clostridia bacterium]|nr:PHP domain-containing protein [Clostridia bacterium]
MKKYKYQMHIHTAPCSACGQMSPKELCQSLHENGYQGTALTNHFYHGNSGIDRSLSWNDFVSAYEKDYNECLEEARKYDLDIIFGIEEAVVPGLELLCYGITPKILYDNPELQNCSLEEFVEIMHKNGAVLIQAHPFREAFYIPNPGHLPVELIDGVEIYNKGNSTEEMNQKALAFANEHPHLIKTSSADAHTTDRVMFGGIITEKRIKSSQELAEVLRAGSYQLIIPGEEI